MEQARELRRLGAVQVSLDRRARSLSMHQTCLRLQTHHADEHALERVNAEICSVEMEMHRVMTLVGRLVKQRRCST